MIVSSEYIVKNSMKAFKLELIQSVAPETLFEKFKTQYKAYWTPEEIQFTPRVIGWYDQAKNNYCTAFASAWCTTYNTWQVFTNEYITEWASKYIKPEGVASMMNISERFAREHWYFSKPINIASIEAETLLNAWYALVISTVAPEWFWKQWVTMWKATWLFTWDIFTHSVYLFREKDRDYIGNSWESLTKSGFWNKIHVELPDLIKNKYIRPISVVIFKK